MTRIGVLALQGDFAAHARVLRDLGAEAVEVRVPSELSGLDGLVIPGGESTTLLNLMDDAPWFPALRSFHAEGGAIMGTCAGAILLAREVTGPKQESLGLIDATIARTAYGRQVDTFESDIDCPALGGTIPAVFIRAPRFDRIGPEVTRLAVLDGQPVMIRQGSVLALTFHPELTRNDAVHRYFLAMAREGVTTEAGARAPAGRTL